MKYSKIFIIILISLVIISIIYNLMNKTQEGISNCVTLSTIKYEPRETKKQFERRILNKLDRLQSELDYLIFPLKFSKKNQEDLKTIGPMQQSISDSQSGDVTKDTKLTGL